MLWLKDRSIPVCRISEDDNTAKTSAILTFKLSNRIKYAYDLKDKSLRPVH